MAKMRRKRIACAWSWRCTAQCRITTENKMTIHIENPVRRGRWVQISEEISEALESDEAKQQRYVDNMFSLVSVNLSHLDQKQ
jgi:hypothetical protein